MVSQEAQVAHTWDTHDSEAYSSLKRDKLQYLLVRTLWISWALGYHLQ